MTRCSVSRGRPPKHTFTGLQRARSAHTWAAGSGEVASTRDTESLLLKHKQSQPQGWWETGAPPLAQPGRLSLRHPPREGGWLGSLALLGVVVNLLQALCFLQSQTQEGEGRRGLSHIWPTQPPHTRSEALPSSPRPLPG